MDWLWIIIIASVLYLIIDGGRILSLKPTINDTLLSKLFRWHTKVEYNGVPFYIRVVSDSTVEDARRAALLASRKMRKQLRDELSDDYLVYLDQYTELNKNELAAYIQISASRDIMRDYLANNPRPKLDETPDRPSQEQLEDADAAKEQRDLDYVSGMQEYVETWRVGFEKQLETMPDEALLRLAKKYRTDELCENLFNRDFEAYVIASSIYSDDKYTKRMMSVEDYRELPTEVQQVLYDAYNNMNLSVDDIKNS